MPISYFLFPVLGYFFGSLPFSIWITRYVKGVDVRDSGSGHATTTNTIRQAGFGWGALVLALDIAKGFIPTYLALNQNVPPYIIVLTASFAVIGHCWTVFAQFRGGMGLATAGGTFLAVNLLAASRPSCSSCSSLSAGECVYWHSHRARVVAVSYP